MDAAALSGEGGGGDPSYLGQQLIGCLLVLLGVAQGHVASYACPYPYPYPYPYPQPHPYPYPGHVASFLGCLMYAASQAAPPAVEAAPPAVEATSAAGDGATSVLPSQERLTPATLLLRLGVLRRGAHKGSVQLARALLLTPTRTPTPTRTSTLPLTLTPTSTLPLTHLNLNLNPPEP